MSDDLGGWYDANMGSTLPDGEGATHNANLSPLFFERVGTVDILPDRLHVGSRGSHGRWYAAQPWGATFAQYLAIWTNRTWPSSKDNSTGAYSLRCLVFTNNRQ